MAKQARAPWKRANPRKRAGKASKHLSAPEKATAKARAKRAGRRYPNLVDNMRMAAKKQSAKKRIGKGRAKNATARKTTAQKTSRKRVSKARPCELHGAAARADSLHYVLAAA